MQSRSVLPSEEEYRVLKRLGVEIRCHRDANFKRPRSKTERVQERFAFTKDGTNYVLEHYAHGLRSLKAPGWFFIFPHDMSNSGRGALTVENNVRFKTDMVCLKMAYA